MGKNSNRKNQKKQKRKKTAAVSKTQDSSSFPSNFFPGAGPGCYIARRDLEPNLPGWMLDWEEIEKDEFVGEEVPELAIDPDEKTLSVCNTRTDEHIIAYITVYETNLIGRCGKLVSGKTTNNQGVTKECITFIVLCPPLVFAHLCYLDVPDGVDLFQDVELESDVQAWNRHPNPLDEHRQPLAFPLHGGPFLCTQGVGGELTHFFNGNLHAIDFRCPVGTALLSVGNGEVVESKDHNTLTGIAVSNLFEWNSIMLKLDPIPVDANGDNDGESRNNDPLYVEYVHIQKSFVKEGDRVTKGQTIGESGSVGFSPEPHLHFAAYRSKANTAPTVKVHFQSETSNELFLPMAGIYYDTNGEANEAERET